MGISIIYKSSNTDNQQIDTIEIDKHQSVEYSIKVFSSSSVSESKINISTDGVFLYETQSGFSSSNVSPLEYTTSNIQYVGRLNVTPTTNNCIFYITKTEYESERYAAHTQSGRKIITDEGISLDKESSLNSLTIRQEGLDYYGNSNLYLVSNVFGPIKTGNNLLTEWLSYNNADIILDPFKVISSGQNENFAYQEIQVTPGKAYSISGNAYFIDPDLVNVKENTQYQSGDSFIRVSDTLDGSEYVNYQLTSTDQAFDKVFTPTSDKIYVKVGYGKRSVESIFTNLICKEVVPFYTFNQTQGTYYAKWTGLNNTSLIVCNNVLRIDSDIIYYNNTNIGTQTTTNQIAISHTGNTFRVSLNGSNAQEFIINNNDKNYSLELNSSLLRFAYMNEPISNTDLKSLSSG